MDIATIAGIVVALGLVFVAIVMEQGMAGLLLFLNTEAFLVVMGGTFCALLVNFPWRQVAGTVKVVRKVLFGEEEKTEEIISTFVNLTRKARTEGILALETDIKSIQNDFLKRGVQLVVDGHDREFIHNMLETELGFLRERHKVGQEIFNALGTYSPAFGIIGTVLGMIMLLATIEDAAQVPKKMAVALAAAFYGLGAGYLLFLPMAGKLRRRSEEEIFVKEIIMRGVLLIHGGATPSIVETNLKAYLEPAKRALIKSAAPAAGPEAGA